MATQVAVHGAAEVRFKHVTYDAGTGSEFRMLKLYVHDAEGNELLEVDVFNSSPMPAREPVALRPVKEDS